MEDELIIFKHSALLETGTLYETKEIKMIYESGRLSSDRVGGTLILIN